MQNLFIKKSWLATSISWIIICIIISYWFMQYQLFKQNKQIKEINPLNISSNHVSLNQLAGEKAKLIFANQAEENNIKLMGIVQDINNKNNSYILIKIKDKAKIYHYGQNIPSLGEITLIENKKISIKNDNGNLQDIYVEKRIINSVNSSNPLNPQKNFNTMPDIEATNSSNLNSPSNFNTQSEVNSTNDIMLQKQFSTQFEKEAINIPMKN